MDLDDIRRRYPDVEVHALTREVERLREIAGEVERLGEREPKNFEEALSMLRASRAAHAQTLREIRPAPGKVVPLPRRGRHLRIVK